MLKVGCYVIALRNLYTIGPTERPGIPIGTMCRLVSYSDEGRWCSISQVSDPDLVTPGCASHLSFREATALDMLMERLDD